MAGTLVADTVKSEGARGPTVLNTNGVEIGQFCRMRANWDMSGTQALRDSFNVASITDGGVGTTTLAFSVAMPNGSYSPLSGAYHAAANIDRTTISSIAAAQVGFQGLTATNTATDHVNNYAAVFGD